MLKRPSTIRLIKEKSLRDPTFFINLFCWTNDPRRRPADLPFILWDYQKKYVRWLEEKLRNQEDGLTDKARDVGVTWMGMAWFLCHWLFDKGFNGHCGSRKEEYVDKAHDIKTLFGKLRYILFRLPVELMPEGFLPRFHSSFMKLFNPMNGNLITGESANKDFGRQARASVVWLDEFAHWEHDEESWTAVGEVSPVKLPVSTPKGRYNCFARLRFKSKIAMKTLPWDLNPTHTPELKKKKKYGGKYTTQQFAQEIEISYSGSAGIPVFFEFQKKKHMQPHEFNFEKSLIRGIDFGRRHPGLILGQMKGGGFHQIYELLGNDLGARDWGWVTNYVSGIKMDYEQIDRIRYLCKNNKIENIDDIAHLQIFHNRGLRDFCDQAGNQKTDKSNQTSIDILSGMGFKLEYRYARIDEGVSILKLMLIQGLYHVTPNCILTLQGFEGGYRVDDDGKPKKDKYYEHIFDALRYIFHNLFSYLEKKKEEVKKDRYEAMIDAGVPWEYVQELKKDFHVDAEFNMDELMEKSHGTGYCLD